MKWIYYVGGLGRADKLLAIAIQPGSRPAEEVARLQRASPFRLKLLGAEVGDPQRLEQIYERFKLARMLSGPWFRATESLVDYVEQLPPIKSSTSKSRRVSLDLSVKDFERVEDVAHLLDLRTKARLLRRALRFYLDAYDLEVQGWSLRAIHEDEIRPLSILKDPSTGRD